MRSHHLLLVLVHCLALAGLCGCKDAENSVSAETGDWTATVTVATYDEFGRSVPATGTMDLTLSLKDQSRHAVLRDGNASYSFTNLPFEKYLATVRKEGYYTGQSTYSWTQYYGRVNIDARLDPLPNPAVRVDSIRCELNTTVPRIYLRLFTPQVLPAGGWRRAVIFAGLSPEVSPRYGNYVSSCEVTQIVGTSYLQTEDVYSTLRRGRIPPGTKVYLTARIITGGTAAWVDEATGLTVYAQLEENTKQTISFIMP